MSALLTTLVLMPLPRPSIWWKVKKWMDERESGLMGEWRLFFSLLLFLRYRAHAHALTPWPAGEASCNCKVRRGGR